MDCKKRNIIIIIVFVVFVMIGGCIVGIKLFANDIKTEDNEDNFSMEDNIVDDNLLGDGEVDVENNDSVENENVDSSNKQETCDKSYAMMYDDKYIYKVKVTNQNGAIVYDSYEKLSQKVVDVLATGIEIAVVADVVDGQKFSLDTKQNKYNNFDEIKDYYYFAIDVCGDAKYVKYNDVEIIENSIVSEKNDKKEKYYVSSDEYLYEGPGLSFEEKDNNKKISRGTILETDTYCRIGNAVWLYVSVDDNQGWILKRYFNSVNYPYDNKKYGSTVNLNEKAGEIYLENDENLYEYAMSSDSIILNIPKGTKLSYNYIVSEPGIDYYYVEYKGKFGWIKVMNF